MNIDWKIVPARQLASLAASWDALQARLLPHAFLRTHFLLPLLEQFGNGDELLAYGEGADGWTAALLLQPIGHGRWNTFQPSQLPLGPVLMPDGDLAAMLQTLLRRLPGLALSLGLTQQDTLFCKVTADTPTLRRQHYIDTAWVDIETDFDTYWEARGKNLRQNSRKQLKKVEATGVTPRLDVIESAVIAKCGRNSPVLSVMSVSGILNSEFSPTVNVFFDFAENITHGAFLLGPAGAGSSGSL